MYVVDFVGFFIRAIFSNKINNLALTESSIESTGYVRLVSRERTCVISRGYREHTMWFLVANCSYLEVRI